MYAVIRTGGKQARVAEGEQLDVELLGHDIGDEVSFTPLLVVDGDTVVAAPADLAAASVSARVLGTSKGTKIRGFTYKNKSNQRRHWGHRQHYSTIEITRISTGSDRPAGEAAEHGAEHELSDSQRS